MGPPQRGQCLNYPSETHRLRAVTRLPLAVGIGVSHPGHAQEVSRHADCVVVGSALIRRFRQTAGAHSVRAVARLAAELAQATNRPRLAER